MKRAKVITVVSLLAAALVLFTGCENSSDASSTTTDAQPKWDDNSTNNATVTKDESSDRSTTEPENSDSEKSDSIDDAGATDTGNNSKVDKEDTSSDDKIVSLKEEYLEKLKDTKKETANMEAEDTSTYALKKLENDRWQIWDELLNEIYRVLNEKLSPEVMEQLRIEQRAWLDYRDNTALEASQKYKGGTQEHLEYVAVLADVTEERCFELVEEYM